VVQWAKPKCMLSQLADPILKEEEEDIPIRVRFYGKPLLLPEEVMKEPLWKIARFVSEAGLLN